MALGLRLLYPTDLVDFDKSASLVEYGARYLVTTGDHGLVTIRFRAKTYDNFGTSTETPSVAYPVAQVQISNSASFESSRTLTLTYTERKQYDVSTATTSDIEANDPDYDGSCMRVTNWALDFGEGEKTTYVRFITAGSPNYTFPDPNGIYLGYSSTLTVVRYSASIPVSERVENATTNDYVARDTIFSWQESQDNISGLRGYSFDLTLQGMIGTFNEACNDLSDFDILDPDTERTRINADLPVIRTRVSSALLPSDVSLTEIAGESKVLLTFVNSGATPRGHEMQFVNMIEEDAPTNFEFRMRFKPDFPDDDGDSTMYAAFQTADALYTGGRSIDATGAVVTVHYLPLRSGETPNAIVDVKPTSMVGLGYMPRRHIGGLTQVAQRRGNRKPGTLGTGGRSTVASLSNRIGSVTRSNKTDDFSTPINLRSWYGTEMVGTHSWPNPETYLIDRMFVEENQRYPDSDPAQPEGGNYYMEIFSSDNDNLSLYFLTLPLMKKECQSNIDSVGIYMSYAPTYGVLTDQDLAKCHIRATPVFYSYTSPSMIFKAWKDANLNFIDDGIRSFVGMPMAPSSSLMDGTIRHTRKKPYATTDQPWSTTIDDSDLMWFYFDRTWIFPSTSTIRMGVRLEIWSDTSLLHAPPPVRVPFLYGRTQSGTVIGAGCHDVISDTLGGTSALGWSFDDAMRTPIYNPDGSVNHYSDTDFSLGTPLWGPFRAAHIDGTFSHSHKMTMPLMRTGLARHMRGSIYSFPSSVHVIEGYDDPSAAPPSPWRSTGPIDAMVEVVHPDLITYSNETIGGVCEVTHDPAVTEGYDWASTIEGSVIVNMPKHRGIRIVGGTTDVLSDDPAWTAISPPGPWRYSRTTIPASIMVNRYLGGVLATPAKVTAIGTCSVNAIQARIKVSSPWNRDPIYVDMDDTATVLNSINTPWQDYVLFEMNSDGSYAIVRPKWDATGSVIGHSRDILSTTETLLGFNALDQIIEVDYRENRTDVEETTAEGFGFEEQLTIEETSAMWEDAPVTILWQEFIATKGMDAIKKISLRVENEEAGPYTFWCEGAILPVGDDGLPIVTDPLTRVDQRTSLLRFDTTNIFRSCVWNDGDTYPQFDTSNNRRWSETITIPSGTSDISLAVKLFTGSSVSSVTLIPGQKYMLCISIARIDASLGKGGSSYYTAGSDSPSDPNWQILHFRPKILWKTLNIPVDSALPERTVSVRALTTSGLTWGHEFRTSESPTSPAIFRMMDSDLETSYSTYPSDLNGSAELVVSWMTSSGDSVQRVSEVFPISALRGNMRTALTGVRSVSMGSGEQVEVEYDNIRYSDHSRISNIDLSGNIGYTRESLNPDEEEVVSVTSVTDWVDEDWGKTWSKRYGGVSGINITNPTGDLVFSAAAGDPDGIMRSGEAHYLSPTEGKSFSTTVRVSLLAETLDTEFYVVILPSSYESNVAEIEQTSPSSPQDFIIIGLRYNGDIYLHRPNSETGIVESELIRTLGQLDTYSWGNADVKIRMTNDVPGITALHIWHGNALIYNTDSLRSFLPESDRGFWLAMGFRSKRDTTGAMRLDVGNILTSEVNRTNPDLYVTTLNRESFRTVPVRWFTWPMMEEVYTGGSQFLAGITRQFTDTDYASAHRMIAPMNVYGQMVVAAGVPDADSLDPDGVPDLHRMRMGVSIDDVTIPDLTTTDRWIGPDLVSAYGIIGVTETNAFRIDLNYELSYSDEAGDSEVLFGIASWLPTNSAAHVGGVVGSPDYSAFSFTETDYNYNTKALVPALTSGGQILMIGLEDEQYSSSMTPKYIMIAFASDGDAFSLIGSQAMPPTASVAPVVTSIGPSYLPSRGRLSIIITPQTTGGGGGGGDVTSPTVSISVDRTTLTQGQSTTLRWSSTNADVVLSSTFGATTLSGSQTIAPSTLGTTTYRITVQKNSTGETATASTSVTVKPLDTGVPAVFLSSPLETIVAGESTNISWSSINASSMATTNLPGVDEKSPINGIVTVSPMTTTTYTMIVQDSSGRLSQQASITITITTTTGDPEVFMSATDTEIDLGESVILDWVSTNVTRVNSSTFGLGPSQVTGFKTVTPTSTTTYEMVVGRGSDSKTASASLTITVNTPVLPDPTATLTASNTTINSGESVTLNWTSTNATKIVSSNFGADTVATGVKTVTPTTSTTYIIIVGRDSDSKTATASILVTVNIAGLTASLSSDKEEIYVGDTYSLSWQSTGADVVTTSTFGASSTQVRGATVLTAMTTNSETSGNIIHSITLKRNADGAEITVTKEIKVLPKTIAVSLAASPQTVQEGHEFTLTWSTSNDYGYCSVDSSNFGATQIGGSKSMTAPIGSTSEEYSIKIKRVFPDGSSSSKTASVIVNITTTPVPIPSVTLNASSTSVNIGDTVHLSWVTSNVTGIVGHNFPTDGNIGIAADFSGTVDVRVYSTWTFYIDVSNSSGTATSEVTINVSNYAIMYPVASASHLKPVYDENWIFKGWEAQQGVVLDTESIVMKAKDSYVTSHFLEPSFGEFYERRVGYVALPSNVEKMIPDGWSPTSVELNMFSVYDQTVRIQFWQHPFAYDDARLNILDVLHTPEALIDRYDMREIGIDATSIGGDVSERSVTSGQKLSYTFSPTIFYGGHWQFAEDVDNGGLFFNVPEASRALPVMNFYSTNYSSTESRPYWKLTFSPPSGGASPIGISSTHYASPMSIGEMVTSEPPMIRMTSDGSVVRLAAGTAPGYCDVEIRVNNVTFIKRTGLPFNFNTTDGARLVCAARRKTPGGSFSRSATVSSFSMTYINRRAMPSSEDSTSIALWEKTDGNVSANTLFYGRNVGEFVQQGLDHQMITVDVGGNLVGLLNATEAITVIAQRFIATHQDLRAVSLRMDTTTGGLAVAYVCTAFAGEPSITIPETHVVASNTNILGTAWCRYSAGMKDGFFIFNKPVALTPGMMYAIVFDLCPSIYGTGETGLLPGQTAMRWSEDGSEWVDMGMLCGFRTFSDVYVNRANQHHGKNLLGHIAATNNAGVPDDALKTRYPLPVDEHTRAMWRMDEDSWSGATYEVTDSGPEGFHGRAYNGATTTDDAWVGRAGLFDNTSADYVRMPKSTLIVPDYDGSQTYELWFKPDSTMATTIQTILGIYWEWTVGDYHHGGIKYDPSTKLVHTNAETTVSTGGYTDDEAIEDEWNHVAWQYDATTKTFTTYLNGKIQPSITKYYGAARKPFPDVGASYDYMAVGVYLHASSQLFGGVVDEIRISDCVRYRTDFDPWRIRRFMPITSDFTPPTEEVTADLIAPLYPGSSTLPPVLSVEGGSAYADGFVVNLVIDAQDTYVIGSGMKDFRIIYEGDFGEQNTTDWLVWYDPDADNRIEFAMFYDGTFLDTRLFYAEVRDLVGNVATTEKISILFNYEYTQDTLPPNLVRIRIEGNAFIDPDPDEAEATKEDLVEISLYVVDETTGCMDFRLNRNFQEDSSGNLVFDEYRHYLEWFQEGIEGSDGVYVMMVQARDYGFNATQPEMSQIEKIDFGDTVVTGRTELPTALTTYSTSASATKKLYVATVRRTSRANLEGVEQRVIGHIAYTVYEAYSGGSKQFFKANETLTVTVNGTATTAYTRDDSNCRIVFTSAIDPSATVRISIAEEVAVVYRYDGSKKTAVKTFDVEDERAVTAMVEYGGLLYIGMDSGNIYAYNGIRTSLPLYTVRDDAGDATAVSCMVVDRFEVDSRDFLFIGTFVDARLYQYGGNIANAEFTWKLSDISALLTSEESINAIEMYEDMMFIATGPYGRVYRITKIESGGLYGYTAANTQLYSDKFTEDPSFRMDVLCLRAWDDRIYAGVDYNSSVFVYQYASDPQPSEWTVETNFNLAFKSSPIPWEYYREGNVDHRHDEMVSFTQIRNDLTGELSDWYVSLDGKTEEFCLFIDRLSDSNWQRVSNSTGWTMEFRVRIGSFGSGNGAFQGLDIYDGTYHLEVRIERTKIVFLSGDASWEQTITFDPTAWHTYRILVQGNEVALHVDDDNTALCTLTDFMTFDTHGKSLAFGKTAHETPDCLAHWNHIHYLVTGAVTPRLLTERDFTREQVFPFGKEVRYLESITGGLVAGVQPRDPSDFGQYDDPSMVIPRTYLRASGPVSTWTHDTTYHVDDSSLIASTVWNGKVNSLCESSSDPMTNDPFDMKEFATEDPHVPMTRKGRVYERRLAFEFDTILKDTKAPSASILINEEASPGSLQVYSLESFTSSTARYTQGVAATFSAIDGEIGSASSIIDGDPDTYTSIGTGGVRYAKHDYGGDGETEIDLSIIKWGVKSSSEKTYRIEYLGHDYEWHPVVEMISSSTGDQRFFTYTLSSKVKARAIRIYFTGDRQTVSDDVTLTISSIDEGIGTAAYKLSSFIDFRDATDRTGAGPDGWVPMSDGIIQLPWVLSTDADNWQVRETGLPIPVVATTFASMMVIGCIDGSIYISTDGDTFQASTFSAAATVMCFAEWNDKLYMGTADGLVHSTENGLSWLEVVDTGQDRVASLAVYDDTLYIGTGDHGYLYSWDGTSLTIRKKFTSEVVSAMATLGTGSDAILHIAVSPTGEFYKFDGSDFSAITNSPATSVTQIVEHSGALYAACDRGTLFSYVIPSSGTASWSVLLDTSRRRISGVAEHVVRGPSITDINEDGTGSLAAGTYYYAISIVDHAGVESLIGEAYEIENFTDGGRFHIQWQGIESARGYRIYRTPEPNTTEDDLVMLAIDELADTELYDDGTLQFKNLESDSSKDPIYVEPPTDEVSNLWFCADQYSVYMYDGVSISELALPTQMRGANAIVDFGGQVYVLGQVRPFLDDEVAIIEAGGAVPSVDGVVIRFVGVSVGSGDRVVYAMFKDDIDNETDALSDTIFYNNLIEHQVIQVTEDGDISDSYESQSSPQQKLYSPVKTLEQVAIYECQPFYASNLSRWDVVQMLALLPYETEVDLYVRTADTREALLEAEWDGPFELSNPNEDIYYFPSGNDVYYSYYDEYGYPAGYNVHYDYSYYYEGSGRIMTEEADISYLDGPWFQFKLVLRTQRRSHTPAVFYVIVRYRSTNAAMFFTTAFDLDELANRERVTVGGRKISRGELTFNGEIPEDGDIRFGIVTLSEGQEETTEWSDYTEITPDRTFEVTDPQNRFKIGIMLISTDVATAIVDEFALSFECGDRDVKINYGRYESLVP